MGIARAMCSSVGRYGSNTSYGSAEGSFPAACCFCICRTKADRDILSVKHCTALDDLTGTAPCYTLKSKDMNNSV